MVNKTKYRDEILRDLLGLGQQSADEAVVPSDSAPSDSAPSDSAPSDSAPSVPDTVIMDSPQADTVSPDTDPPDTLGLAAGRREAMRQEMLQRRRRYLDRQRQLAAPARQSPGWRKFWVAATPCIVVLAVAGLIGTALLGTASAKQDKQNRSYAQYLLGTASDYFCNDLLVLNLSAVEAEALLPAASVLGLSSNDWQHLYSSSRATRCLFTARLGQPDLAADQLRQAREFSASYGDLQSASEIRIVFDLCMGKACQSIMETYVDLGQGPKASPLYNEGITFLDDALQGLAQQSFLLPDETHVLSAGLQIDLARLRMKTPAPTTLGVTGEDSLAFQITALDSAEDHLRHVNIHDAAWWIQNLRLLAHREIQHARDIDYAPIAAVDIDSVLAEHARVLALLDMEVPAPPSQFDNALRYEKAIYTSNLADTLSYSLTAEQVPEFGERVISLRSQAIGWLTAVPEYSQSALHRVNLRINCARRMLLNARFAVGGGDTRARQAAMLADAAVLQIELGDLLGPPVVQLGRRSQALAAMVLGYDAERIRAFCLAHQADISDADRELIDAMETLLSQTP